MSLSQLQNIFSHSALILYLFTCSDFKTILFPVATFSMLSTPHTSFARLPPIFIWIWIHLLQFAVSNQSMNVTEDIVNKPWRPLPAGHMNISQARLLRWGLLPLCFIISICCNALAPSAILAATIIAHNELGFHAHWLPRNICNALGYASFNVGATFVACTDLHCSLGSPAFSAHLTITLIVLTTIQAQDFRDMEGDRLTGRKTIPVIWPVAGRTAMLLLLSGWSIFLSIFCRAGPITSVIFIALGCVVGVRFVKSTTEKDDRNSYILYNIWLSLAPMLPLFGHISP